MKTKKVLLITRNLPPLIGGMERLNFNIYKIIEKIAIVNVVGPKGCKEFLPPEQVIEFPVKPMWTYLLVSLAKSLFFSFNKKFDVVFCGSGAAILAGYFSAKVMSARLVCYLHGLDLVVNNKIYQLIFIPLIKRSDLLIVNSLHTRNLAITSGMDAKKIEVLYPGVKMPDCNPSEFLRHQAQKKLNVLNVPVLLIAGRITRRKGIAEFIIKAMPELKKKFPTLQLLILGGEAVDAVKSEGGVVDEIRKAISSYGLENNVKMLGRLDDAHLAAAFIASDAMIFPVLDLPFDVEGFGMVAIEAASYGLPTIGFSVGGVKESIGDNISGCLVDSGNYSLLLERIVSVLDGSKKYSSSDCISFAKEFEWEKFADKLEKMLF